MTDPSSVVEMTATNCEPDIGDSSPVRGPVTHVVPGTASPGSARRRAHEDRRRNTISFVMTDSLSYSMYLSSTRHRYPVAPLTRPPNPSIVAVPHSGDGGPFSAPTTDDMYSAASPHRRRSILVSMPRLYHPVADDPRVGARQTPFVERQASLVAHRRPFPSASIGSEATSQPGAVVVDAAGESGDAPLPYVRQRSNTFPRSFFDSAAVAVPTPVNSYKYFLDGPCPDRGAAVSGAEEPTIVPFSLDVLRRSNLTSNLPTQADAVGNAFVRGLAAASTAELSRPQASPCDHPLADNRSVEAMEPEHAPFGSNMSSLVLEPAAGVNNPGSNTKGSIRALCREAVGHASFGGNEGFCSDPLQRPARSPDAGSPLLDLQQATRLVEDLSRSIAFNRQTQPGSPMYRYARSGQSHDGKGADITTSAFTMDVAPAAPGSFDRANLEDLAQTRRHHAEADIDAFFDLPMPYVQRCTTCENLNADWVTTRAALLALKALLFSGNLLFAMRTILFAALPLYILVNHPKTSGWFAAGQLLPMFTCLSVAPTLGGAVVAAVANLQAVGILLVWGTLMAAFGIRSDGAAWWCAILFGSFGVSMLMDGPAKRLAIGLIIIIMQMQDQAADAELNFSALVTRDFIIMTGICVVSAILPFPVLVVKQADAAMDSIHKLYAAGVGNAVKAYWAPVSLDRKSALSQVPFATIGNLTTEARRLIALSYYEPSEFNLNNTLRTKRLEVLGRVRMRLYQMVAAASQSLDEGPSHSSRAHKAVQQFEARVKGPCLELAGEVIAVLTQLGKYISPKDVAEKINYDQLYNRSVILNDIIERERAQTFFLRNTNPEDTNSYLRTLAFMTSLVDLSSDIEKMERRMRDFDHSEYPSRPRRCFNFLVGDFVRELWVDLPKRVTLATPRHARFFKDGVKYACGFTVVAAFTGHYGRDSSYSFGFIILIRIAQQTASETLSVGISRIFGLSMGCACVYLIAQNTDKLALETLAVMSFSLIAMCFVSHPIHGNGALYTVVLLLGGVPLAREPLRLLVRIVDNCFAFVFFFLICALIFPMDPIRVLWNTRTHIFMRMNDLMQTFVTIGCSPVTQDGAEASMFIEEGKRLVTEQLAMLREYQNLMCVCEHEPTLRGGVYPHQHVVFLLRHLSEVTALQESIADAMTRLHRPRAVPPSTLIHDVMELTRPFLLDVGKIVYHFLQSMIDATEAPEAWSMEEALGTLWKGQLACKSLRAVTGHIQRNFFAAVLQVSEEEKHQMNVYLPASFVVDALSKQVNPRLRNPENEELLQRLFATSFHMSRDTIITRDDMQAFNAIAIVFELVLKVFENMLPTMVEIHEWEKSRRG